MVLIRVYVVEMGVLNFEGVVGSALGGVSGGAGTATQPLKHGKRHLETHI